METTLRDIVESFCKQIGKDVDDVVDVKMNHVEQPTQIKVFFRGESEPLVIDLKYPQNA